MTIRIPLPRWLHHLWATLCGFYWLPCPVCGRMYGGHEANPWGHSIRVEDGRWMMTCPRCPVEYRPLDDNWGPGDRVDWVAKTRGVRVSRG